MFSFKIYKMQNLVMYIRTVKMFHLDFYSERYHDGIFVTLSYKKYVFPLCYGNLQ